MNFFAKKLFLFFVFLFSILFLFAEPSLEPSVLYAPQGELTPRQIISTALEYSLCSLDSEEGKMCLLKYDSIEKSVLKKFSELDKNQSARELLPFLYNGILFNYVEKSTKLNTTLMTGEYNCVTASLLYLSLAKALGIDVRGQETKLHAFVTVYIDGQKIDVETTNPRGFNPGVKQTVSQTENSRTYSYVPKKYYAGRHEVSDRAFATLTGKNLAADMNDTEEYDTAIPLEVSRFYFLNGDQEQKTALSDLDVLVTNYALIEAKKGNTRAGVDFLVKVSEKFGKSREVQKTLDNIVYNGAVNFLNDNQNSEARQFFDSNRQFMSAEMALKVDRMITTNQLRHMEVEVHNSVVPLFNSGRYEEAKQILEEALKEYPESAALKKDLSLVKRALQQ